MGRSRGTSYLVALAFAVAVATPAAAHPGHGLVDDGEVDSAVEAAHQHGHVEGHLPAGSENVTLIGSLDVNPPEGGIADLAVKGNYAYLNAWQPYCPNAGTHIVDISDPGAPRMTGTVAEGTGEPGLSSREMRVSAAQGLLVVLVVEDLDAEFDRIAGEGARVLTAPETEPWGERYFQVTDPCGVVVQLVQWVQAP